MQALAEALPLSLISPAGTVPEQQTDEFPDKRLDARRKKYVD